MYRLMIVEDEKWEREGLQDFLDWENLGIKVTGCASNGIEGKKLAEEIQPHIIITDIKMPLMDGIQMSREIRSFLPETYIIILSGYDEFDYAKQAFEFDATAYLLKPLKKETLKETILNVLKKLEDKQKHQNEKIRLESQWLEYTNKNCDYLLFDFINQKIDLSYISELPLIKRLISFDRNAVAVFLLSVNPEKTVYEEKLNAETESDVLNVFDVILGAKGIAISCSENTNEVIVCMDASLTGEELEKELLKILSEIRLKTGIYCIAGIGEAVAETESIPLSYKQARKALEFKFLANYGELLFYRDIMESAQKNWNLTKQLIKSVDSVSGKVIKNIISGDINSGVSHVDEFLAIMREYPSESKILLNCFIMNIVNELNMMFSSNSDGVYVALFNTQKGAVDSSVFGSLLQTRKYLLGFLSRIAINMKKDSNENNVAMMVLKIIEERYMEELTLKRISEEIHLYPYYIGSIFKEYTGKTFNQFLNEYRIDKAKEILDKKKGICQHIQPPGYRMFGQDYHTQNHNLP